MVALNASFEWSGKFKQRQHNIILCATSSSIISLTKSFYFKKMTGVFSPSKLSNSVAEISNCEKTLTGKEVL